MNCNIVKDLLPLYIDGCCSEESKKCVEEHIKACDMCKKVLEDMNTPCDGVSVSQAPIALNKVNDRKASVLQSVLLFLSFALITIGVALEARTPYGPENGFWALNLIVPATGFMLSLANWYFVRVYKNRKSFSNCSLIATLVITICAYVWSGFHYEMSLFDLFGGNNFASISDALHALLDNGIGILLTVVFCASSKILSDRYAGMLGKE